MIIVLKPNANAKQVENLTHWLRSSGFDLHTSVGAQHTILGLVGDTSRLDIDLLGGLDVVESVQRIALLKELRQAGKSIPEIKALVQK